MIKAEWGTKRQCPKCGTRFYDLMQEDPVTCISCGNAWIPEPILKSKQSLSFDSAKTEGQGGEGSEAEDLEIDDESDEPSVDNAVDIGDDGDDLAEVVVEKDDEERS